MWSIEKLSHFYNLLKNHFHTIKAYRTLLVNIALLLCFFYWIRCRVGGGRWGVRNTWHPKPQICDSLRREIEQWRGRSTSGM